MQIPGNRIMLQRAGGGGIPGGAWVPWDALVSNNPGVGDYPLISDACAMEPAGAVIAVDCNSTTPYVEIADIVLKEGQTVFAFDGVRAAGTVVVLMGDFQVRMPNNDPTLEGIYFHCDNMTAASVGEYKCDISGAGGLGPTINRCVFNLDNSTAGLPRACRGMRITGAVGGIIRDVKVLPNDFVQRPLEMVNCFSRVTIEDSEFSGSLVQSMMVSMIQARRLRLDAVNTGLPAVM